MAEIKSETIATFPIKQRPKIRFLLEEDWHLPIKRIWGRKTVDRHVFHIEGEDSKPKWFECNEQLASNILKNIESFIVENHIDRKKLKSLDIIIGRSTNGESVATICDTNAPKMGMFARMIKWLKRLK